MKLRNINATVSSLRLPSGNFVNLEGYLYARWKKDFHEKDGLCVLIARMSGNFTLWFYDEDARHVAAYLRACSDVMTED